MANGLVDASLKATWDATAKKYHGKVMAVNDLFINAYTSAKQVNYNGNEWAAANPTIWVDATTFDNDIENWQLDSGWGWATSTRVEIRFLNQMRMAGAGAGNTTFMVQDMEDVAIFAELFGDYMGLLTEGDVELSPDLFGLVVKDSATANTRELSYEGLTAITKSEAHGVCVMRGFAGDRVARNNNSSNLEIIRRNCMSIDAADGEGNYFGQTGDAATNPTISIDFENYLIVQRGQEAMQAQDLQTTTGGVTGKIRKLTMINPDVTWRNTFQANQDTGWQLDFLQGDIDVEDFVLFGGFSQGLQIFSHDKTARGFNPTGTIRIKNGVISQLGDLGIRVHGSYDDGPALEIQKVYITDIDSMPFTDLGRTRQTHLVESGTTANTGPRKQFRQITYQNGKTNFSDPTLDTDDTFFFFENTNDDTIETPAFKIDPFYLAVGNIPQLWQATYSYDVGTGNYNASSTDAINYVTASKANPYTGDIVYAVMTGAGRVGDYYFFRCILNHAGTTASSDPETDVFVNGDGQIGTYWEIVRWDSNNVPNYHPSWNVSNTPLSYRYYGNYRLATTSQYAPMEMGIVSDFQPADQTKHVWEVARDNAGAPDLTTTLNVLGEFGEVFDSTNYSWCGVGDWVRAKVTEVGKSEKASAWVQIT